MILKEGSYGHYVELLQQGLNKIGSHISVDGNFGPATRNAVMAFQSSHGLFADGIVGPLTQAALMSAVKGEVPPVITPPVIVDPVDPIHGDDSEYRKLYDSMSVRSNWMHEVNSNTDLMLRGKARYETLSPKVNVPWYLIGCIHLLEGSCNFNTHLHNGDSLKARTHNVPAGRPRSGEPPFTWEESAIDALSYDHIKPPLETIGQQFSALEHFNGMGYRSHGIHSPYLWSGSNHYSSGKYVSDGVWSSIAVSEQVGAACIYKILQDRGIIKL